MRITCRPSRGVGHGTARARKCFLAWDEPKYSQCLRFLCLLQRKRAVASRHSPLPSYSSTTPSKKNFADYFDYAGRHFLIVGARLSGWSDVFGTPAGTTVIGANALVRLLWSYFATFGVPEKISSDGGPEFTAFVTPDFMRKWDTKHRVSSAYFPQSNGRAEVAVKAAKRLLMSNISPNGDLFLRALLQLRNIPDPDCDLSPAEIGFGHPLRDAFSFVNRLPLFPIALFVVLGAKHGELKRFKPSGTITHWSHVHVCCVRYSDRVFIQNQGGKHPRKWTKLALWSKHCTATNIMLKWEDSVV